MAPPQTDSLAEGLPTNPLRFPRINSIAGGAEDCRTHRSERDVVHHIVAHFVDGIERELLLILYF